MADINLQLLPGTTRRIEIHRRGENKYLIISVIFAVLIGALYLGVSAYLNSIVTSVQALDSELLNVEKSRDKEAEEKLLILKDKLGVTGDLLSNHLFWSYAADTVQKLTQPQVQFKNWGADNTSFKINIKAEAASFVVLAKQVAAFLSNDAFINVSVGKVTSLPTGRIEFDLQLVYDPHKLLIKPPELLNAQ